MTIITFTLIVCYFCYIHILELFYNILFIYFHEIEFVKSLDLSYV